MSHIDDVIKRYAPDGVQYKTLDEALPTRLGGYWGVEAGTADVSAYAIRNGDVGATGRLRWGALPLRGFTEKEFAKARVRAGDVAMTTSGNCGNVVHIRDHPPEPTVATNFVRILRGDPAQLDSRYAFHFLRSAHFTDRMSRFVRGAAMPNLSVDEAFRAITIPVPPIEVQREIAIILDSLTELEAELETELVAELEARLQQYVHYRKALLTFDGGLRRRPLGELARNRDNRRKPITKAARVSGDIPYYGASGIVDHVSGFIFDGSYLLVSEDGANLLARTTPIAFSVTGKTWVNNHAHVLEFDTDEERRFVEIYLNSIDLAPFVTGAAQPKLNKASLSSIPIPDPPLDEKRRVVSLLDELEVLVSGIRDALSAELRARRSQCAHHLNRLLAFEELGA